MIAAAICRVYVLLSLAPSSTRVFGYQVGLSPLRLLFELHLRRLAHPRLRPQSAIYRNVRTFSQHR